VTLTPGTPAVPFNLPATTGDLSLEQFSGQSFLLSFYSMAFTPV